MTGTSGPGPVSGLGRGAECQFQSQELFAVDAELKRTAKGIIDRILHLRDSL
jgi:hypothetical protein